MEDWKEEAAVVALPSQTSPDRRTTAPTLPDQTAIKRRKRAKAEGTMNQTAVQIGNVYVSERQKWKENVGGYIKSYLQPKSKSV